MVHALEWGVHQTFGSSHSGQSAGAAAAVADAGVGIPHVEDCPGNLVVLQCLVECGLVDDRRAGDVDEHGACGHPGQRRGVDEAGGRGCERAGQDKVVGPLLDLGQTSRRQDPSERVGFGVVVNGDHVDAESGRTGSDRAPDAPVTD